MCGYSLMGVPNRLAQKGDCLETFRFPTGCTGLAATADISKRRVVRLSSGKIPLWEIVWDMIVPPITTPVVAVCVPPGARLRVSGISRELRRMLGIASIEDVTFIQLSSNENVSRDAVRFFNGRTHRLRDLPARVRFEVLSLESAQVESLFDLNRRLSHEERTRILLNG
jgi:hypothetical protein